jgi:hypothetical protein
MTEPSDGRALPIDLLDKKQPNPKPSSSPSARSRKKEVSPEEKLHKERLHSARKTKMSDRTAEWQTSYLGLLKPNEKQNYQVLVAKNKKLKEELKAIVTATEHVIIKEK